MESSAVRVLVALVKAERKRAAALENVAEFLKKQKEQSDALFTQAKEEMEEARNKLAEAEQVRRLLLSKTCWERCNNSKFSTHHQDQSMEILPTREREGVHLHTLEDR